jgi:hypothetical protein
MQFTVYRVNQGARLTDAVRFSLPREIEEGCSGEHMKSVLARGKVISEW